MSCDGVVGMFGGKAEEGAEGRWSRGRREAGNGHVNAVKREAIGHTETTVVYEGRTINRADDKTRRRLRQSAVWAENSLTWLGGGTLPAGVVASATIEQISSTIECRAYRSVTDAMCYFLIVAEAFDTDACSI